MANHTRPIGVDQIGEFDALIDARSPSEFALDHLPGAISCPVLDDDERRIVGTLYEQQGAFEARRVGGAMVAANLARHLQERFADKPGEWRPLVYCWRGGLRSGSMVTWLRMVGWDAQQLAGGYKSWRRHVIVLIEHLAPQLKFRVLCGATGSAKTRVLQALAAEGAQVLDLEAMARHKGSVLGALPGVEQPSQKAFETDIADALSRIDLARPVYVEAESRRIGRLAVPLPLLENLRASPCIEIDATPAARLEYLLRDYAYLGDDREELVRKIGLLHGLQPNETLARWQGWAAEGRLPELFGELMSTHYDPLYARSQNSHLLKLCEAMKLPTDDLSPAGIDTLAAAILAREPRPIERASGVVTGD
ncbi:MAG TPA: tRNA 2-selenouridine(34) synthase MnmH [Burkholderiaceae bacterium]|nr:tRNA 2-selenouridine(34) synthase MnmH [Burkholderiaceae bacterium]